jgi:hypothetical protein
METLLVIDHHGNVKALPMAEVVALDSYGTIGWDYLDQNGSWYAVRALLPCQRRRW